MAGEITLQQMFQTPVITGVIQTIATPDEYMQNFFKVGVGATSQNKSGRQFGWDIFNPTRTVASIRAPGSGPATVQRKAVSVQFGHAVRAHEKVMLLQEEIFRTRPFGAAIGTVDTSGQFYIAKQLEYVTRRFKNLREFAVSRLFRGGFGIKLVGENWYPVESDNADAVFTVNSLIPSENKDQLDMGTGSDIIDIPWNDPSADIHAQLLKVNQANMRLSGFPLAHVLINSNTAQHLSNNVVLQRQGGLMNTPFSSYTTGEGGENRGAKAGAHAIRYRAIPWVTFHIYDGVLNIDTGDVDSTTLANSSYTIPDNVAIMTPEPSSQWIYNINGSEIVAENLMDPGKEVFGFHTWKTRVIDPAGWELKMVDNFLPVISVPSAVQYATVIF